MAWWTSLSNCFTCLAIRFSCFLVSFDSTKSSRSVCAFSFVLVLLDGGALAVLVCDHVFHDGALALTVGVKDARLMRCLKTFVD